MPFMGILVDGDEFSVAKNLNGVLCCVAQIRPQQKMALKEGLVREMSALLCDCEVTDRVAAA